MRLSFFCLVVVALGACGTVCDGVVGAERSLKARALDCNVTITIDDNTKCNDNVNAKCTGSDFKALQDYTSCLNAVPACTMSSQSSFSSSYVSCQTTALKNISFTCLTSIL